MKPMTPVVAGFEEYETVIAKDQEEYLDLPALVLQDGRVITRWRLTWWERLRLLWFGSFYLHQLTFGHALQPQLPTLEPVKLTQVMEGGGCKVEA